MPFKIDSALYSGFFSAAFSLICSYYTTKSFFKKQVAETDKQRLIKTFENNKQALIRKIEKIERDARIYWLKDGQDASLEGELKSSFLYLGQDFKTAKLNNSLVGGKRRHLYNTVTGGNFESKKKTSDQIRVDSILNAAADLRKEVLLSKMLE